MRFLVVLVSLSAALALIAASGLMNWVFMTSLGKSAFERQILGAVSIAVSAFLALLPTLMLWAWREGRTLYMLLGVPVFLAFAAFSLSSAIGFAAKNRGSLSEDRAFATARLAGIRHEAAEAETKLKAFGNIRPLAVVQEQLRALEQDRRWSSSNSCRDATTESSRNFCKGYFDLKAEAARSAETSRLQDRMAELRREGRHLEEQGAGREADNQAAVLARVFGWEAETVERGLMLFLAILVEIGAALGLYFATGHMRLGAPVSSQKGRGITIIEGEIVNDDAGTKPVAAAKAAVTKVPRRVPRLGHSVH